MKKILLSLLFSLFVTVGYAQQSPDGPWNIPFGSSIEQVKSIVKEKHGVAPAHVLTDCLVYKQCRFGGYEASSIDFHFYKGKLYMGIVSVKPATEPEILDEYKELVKALSEKYGKPSLSVETYRYPYEKGDGHEVMAIRGGYTTIGDVWYFPAGTDEETAKVTIVMGVVDEMYISVTYQQEDLKRMADEAEKKKEQSDY